MLPLTGIDEVKANVGKELGVSDWLEVTQEAINEFADVTGDHQFIHVDVEKAKETPFGGTIAHGYYTLSLLPKFSYEMYSFDGFAFGLNYGLNKVRFPAPLPVGSKVRMRAELVNVEDVPGGIQITTKATFETDAGDKPVCAAEPLARPVRHARAAGVGRGGPRARADAGRAAGGPDAGRRLRHRVPHAPPEGAG